LEGECITDFGGLVVGHLLAVKEVPAAGSMLTFVQ
jgi:hypothetical protein